MMSSLDRPNNAARNGLILAGLFTLAFILRTWFGWEQVFGAGFARFTGIDAWYHLRLIDNLLAHFPVPLSYDPYLKFPDGQDVNVAPALDILIASIALLLGVGSPSVELVETIAALTPPVLGAAMIFPVYALGRMLFSPRTGLLAAALLVILPGYLLARSTIGYVDHHVAEVLLSTLTLMLLIHALQSPKNMPAGRALLAGTALAAYLAAWSGGALFIAATSIAFWSDSLLYPRGDARAKTRRAAIYIITLATALLLIAPTLYNYGFYRYHVLALVGSIASVAGLRALDHGMYAFPAHRWTYPLAGIAATAGTVFVLQLAFPELMDGVMQQLNRMVAPPGMLVAEALPLLHASMPWPLLLFSAFGLTLPFALCGAILALRDDARTIQTGSLLLVCWFGIALLAMFGQVRFGYYAAVPVALLTGLACDRTLVRWHARRELCMLLIALVVFVPCAQLTRAQVANIEGPADDWLAALSWLREHTPEPLASAEEYFSAYTGYSERSPYPFPDDAYSVMSWWDPGYWIIRIGRRIPTTNPRQSNLSQAAGFFLATDERAARDILHLSNARYVIVSDRMVTWQEPDSFAQSRYLESMQAALGATTDDYYETYYEQQADGSYHPRVLYYPKYYQTMLNRLYSYAGQSSEGYESSFVVSFSETTDSHGYNVKTIISLQAASSYAEAVALVAAHPQGLARVVGIDPFQTCVPLDELVTMSPVYASPTNDQRAAARAQARQPALVQIFEYRPPADVRISR